MRMDCGDEEDDEEEKEEEVGFVRGRNKCAIGLVFVKNLSRMVISVEFKMTFGCSSDAFNIYKHL